MFPLKLHRKIGDSLVEYALVLGIVSLAIIGMNTYIKRGFQGRIKQMSDKFISAEQVAETDPTTVADSFTTVTAPESVAERKLLRGGAIQTGISDSTRIEIERRTVTQADPATAPQEVVPGRAIIKPVYPEDDGGGTYMPPYWPGQSGWSPPLSFPSGGSSGD